MPRASDREYLGQLMRENDLGMINVHRMSALHNDRNTVEMYLMGLAFFVGVMLFVHPPELAHHVPDAWRYAWRILLILGSGLVLTGLLWTGRVLTAFTIQEAGYGALGFGAMAFGVAAMDGYAFSFGVAALLRFAQIDYYIYTVLPNVAMFSAIGRTVTRLRGSKE